MKDVERAELAAITAQLQQQHNTDGTHGDVTFALGSATAIDAGAGVWMGPTSERGISGVENDYDFRVGDPEANYFEWDGSTHVLTVTGTITAAAGTIGGWTIGASSLTGGDATLASSGNLTLGAANNVIRLSADDATYRLWVGHATAGSAPFSITKAGALTATNATITGASGTVTIDSSGIVVTPQSSGSYSDLRAYHFTTGDGRELGTYAYDTASLRSLSVRSRADSVSANLQIYAQRDNTPNEYTAALNCIADTTPTLEGEVSDHGAVGQWVLSTSGFAWGGGSTIASSTNVVLKDAANTITSTGIQSIAGTIALTTNNKFVTGLTTGAATKNLIGVNSSNLVSIDSNALGTSVGGTLAWGGGSTLASSSTLRHATATASMTSGVATTAITLPGVASAVYVVVGHLGGAAATHSFSAIITCGTGASTFAIVTSAISGVITAVTVDNSGNVQVNQSAATQDITVSYQRIQ